MATSPDQLTDEIAANRARMGTTLDEVGSRTDPRQAWERRKPQAQSKMRQVRETVMGTAHEASDRAQGSATAVSERVAGGTQGNPLAAGIIAFGAGLLAGSVVPSTRTEDRMVHDIQERVEEPVRSSLQESGREAAERVGDRANEAVETTRQSASQSADEVRGSAKESAESVRDESRRAAEDVRRDVEGR